MRNRSQTRLSNEARSGDARRADLARHAFSLIAEKGLEGFRVRDVAAQGGVNIATLHYHFPTKEELIQAVADHILQFFMAMRARPAGDTQRTALEQLCEEVRNVEAQLDENGEMFVVLIELSARAPRDPAIWKAIERMEYGWRSYLASIVMRGHRDGSIRADLDAHRAASILSSMIKGTCNQAVCAFDKPDFRGVADEVARWMRPSSG